MSVRIDGTEFANAGKTAAIAEGTAKVVRSGAYEVAVFNLGDEFVAYENVCPHQGGPIGEGFVEGATVTCPWHAWCFDLRTGSLTLGDFACLRRFETRVADGRLYVATRPTENDV
ncbi:MAG TPA: Rieske 2Fe-2S domain-containing protein [Candidatus Baltobacteraceae bacterium]|nr:Rieske 2Fe-2S domain-containing protein [Candidatus Baltobacteraceae bacterium]